jgi:hypothetical protein
MLTRLREDGLPPVRESALSPLVRSKERSMTASSSTISRRLIFEAAELDRRLTAGGDVRLIWIPELDELLVEQRGRHGEQLPVTRREAPKAHCYDVFHHPELYPKVRPAYGYAVGHGVIELGWEG